MLSKETIFYGLGLTLQELKSDDFRFPTDSKSRRWRVRAKFRIFLLSAILALFWNVVQHKPNLQLGIKCSCSSVFGKQTRKKLDWRERPKKESCKIQKFKTGLHLE